jgi:ferrous iron transport protein A
LRKIRRTFDPSLAAPLALLGIKARAAAAHYIMHLTLSRKKRDNARAWRGFRAAMTLAELALGATAKVVAVVTADTDLELKLREVGFSEGDEVELIARGPFGGQPLAVRLNRTIIAVRLAEAGAVVISDE